MDNYCLNINLNPDDKNIIKTNRDKKNSNISEFQIKTKSEEYKFKEKTNHNKNKQLTSRLIGKHSTSTNSYLAFYIDIFGKEQAGNNFSARTTSKKRIGQFKGLDNFGNFCYSNSIMQCLTTCKDFYIILETLNNLIEQTYKSEGEYPILRNIFKFMIFYKCKY